jgi:hypothetical protein
VLLAQERQGERIAIEAANNRRAMNDRGARHPKLIKEVRAELAAGGGPLWQVCCDSPFRARIFFEIAGQRPVSRAEIKEGQELVRRRRAIRRASIGLDYNRGGVDPIRVSSPSGLPLARRPSRPKELAEFASGIFWLELRGNKAKAFRRASTVAMPVERGDVVGRAGWQGDADHGIAPSRGAYQPGPQPVSREEWEKAGYHLERLPTAFLVSPEDRELLDTILAQSPGRKRGRPPMDDKAMTDTERAARYQASLKRLHSMKDSPSLAPGEPGDSHVPDAAERDDQSNSCRMDPSRDAAANGKPAK